MTPTSLLHNLRARGVRLRVVGSSLQFLPRDLDTMLLESMRQHRDGLMAILRVEQATDGQMLGECDLARAIDRIDAADRLMAAAPRRGCNACGREDWYEHSHPAQHVCRHCHPPQGTPSPIPEPATRAELVALPRSEPGAWACPRGHRSDPSNWRRWGCGACRLQAEAVA